MDRVVTILEQARSNVVRAVNSNMVIAYWLIGREIVEAVQGGGEQAEYGQNLLERLAKNLTDRYRGGFSLRNLRLFIKRLSIDIQFGRHCLPNSAPHVMVLASAMRKVLESSDTPKPGAIPGGDHSGRGAGKRLIQSLQAPFHG
jgi:hypothetical protein